ncbi:MAG: hypothetical protein NT027_03640, partial [Proteobacteria bacterium]|nr:hypothetical protein [Pseudomonadota bacterium]
MSSLISMMCISCGMKESEPSKTKDEVNPVGSHQHYLGNIRIDGPGYRKFPDALKTNVSIEYTTSTDTKVQRFPTSSIADHDSFNTAVGPLKGYATKVYFMGDRLNHLWTLLDFTPTEQNFSKAANKFRRIDVNHVLITRQDGTKYFAPGKYVIQYLNRNLQYIDFH